MVERYGVITNCTARKKAIEPVARLSDAELAGGAKKVAARWSKTIAATGTSTTAGDLYHGRAMSESKDIAALIDGSLHIVSAGLGLASKDDRVPNYDLTVGVGGALKSALEQAGSSTGDWWWEVNAQKGTPMPLSGLINRCDDTRFLLALPSAYIEMLVSDLESVEDRALQRLYIFTSTMGGRLMSKRLMPCILPYDERLEGHERYAGTRADFPQRAMRHFVDQLRGHQLTRTLAIEAVIECLQPLSKPQLPLRARKSDFEIRGLLRAHWRDYGGRSSRLLRFLRDTALVRCEQERFTGLWRQVKAEFQ